jgi:hypothetical protein
LLTGKGWNAVKPKRQPTQANQFGEVSSIHFFAQNRNATGVRKL